MTESLFFSQIATKSIDAKNLANSASNKLFRDNSHDFDKHLSLSDRGANRGRSRDDVTDNRREPTFSRKENRSEPRPSERPTRETTAEKAQSSRPERAEEQKSKPEARRDREGKKEDQTNVEAKSKDANPATETTKPAETAENGEFDAVKEAAILVGEDAAGLVEGGEEELALEALVTLTEGEGEASGEKEAVETSETAKIIPLFGQTTENTDTQLQDKTTLANVAAQITSSSEEVNDTELTGQAQVKQTGAAKQNPAIPVLEAKQTTDGSKPGLETALGKLQGTKPNAEAKPAGEVTTASKQASFLGDVNIEEAQASEKTDIKARISDLAQRTNAGPVSTTIAPKTAANITQITNAKIDAAGQVQALNPEAGTTGSQQTNSVHVRFGNLPQTTQSAQIPVTTIAFHIAKSVENGVNRFEIRIDPPELGRVDVRLEVNKTGRVIANLTVERPETLDLLQRDQRALERALEDAGLDVGGQSLNFSLRDQNTESSEDTGFNADQTVADVREEEETIEPEIITGYVTNSGVDIRI